MTFSPYPTRLALLAVVWFAGAPAFAQSNAPAATAPAADPTAATTAPASEAPPAAEAAPGCFPACRQGYVCYVNQCISACNPPCASDEHCTGSGQCEHAPGPAQAQAQAPTPTPPVAPADPSAAPGYQRHDGFMLRLSAGGGGGGVHFDGDSNWGGAGFFAFDVGGSPMENFVVTFRMSTYVFAVEDNTRIIDYAGVGTYGLGLTWYFMPFNLYLTASLAFANISLVDVDSIEEVDSDGGFGTGLDVGKEWWVNKSWGLGLAARFVYVTSDIYSSTGLGVVFSATYQ